MPWYYLHRPTAKASGFYEVACGACGKQAYASLTMKPADLAKQFVGRGWGVGGKYEWDARCPACYETDKARHKLEAAVPAAMAVFDPAAPGLQLASTPIHLQYTEYLTTISIEARAKELKRVIVAAGLVEMFVNRLSIARAWELAEFPEKDAFVDWLREQNIVGPAAPAPEPLRFTKRMIAPTFVEIVETDEATEPAEWWQKMQRMRGAQ